MEGKREQRKPAAEKRGTCDFNGKISPVCALHGGDRVVESGEAADRTLASVLGGENSVNNLPHPEDPDRSHGGVCPSPQRVHRARPPPAPVLY